MTVTVFSPREDGTLVDKRVLILTSLDIDVFAKSLLKLSYQGFVFHYRAAPVRVS